LRRSIRHKRDILARNHQGLVSAIKTSLRREKGRFEVAIGTMNALSPLAILQRGFALCRDAQGDIVKSASRVVRGDKVRVTLASGELACKVEDIKT
jgi:exodeoxyribonuclease VII large subunit